MLDTYGCYNVLKGEAGLPIKLGQSAWGDVYKAFNNKLRCYAALRMIPRGDFADEESREKFANEIRLASYIRHRGLATVFPLESAEDAYLYATEFCDGETLADRLAREGRLSTAQALSVGSQVAAALDTVGAAGLLHRRMTAHNIILMEGEEDDFTVKVVDLALPLTSFPDNQAPTLDCDFRSPEETGGKGIDSRSAIYSLGALLYYMLGGLENYRLFRPNSLADQGDPIDDSMNLAPGLEAILNKTLCYDPDSRIQTFAELRDLLDEVSHAPAPAKSHVADKPARTDAFVAPKPTPAAQVLTESKPRGTAPLVEKEARPSVPATPIPQDHFDEPIPSRPAPVLEKPEVPAPPEKTIPAVVEPDLGQAIDRDSEEQGSENAPENTGGTLLLAQSPEPQSIPSADIQPPRPEVKREKLRNRRLEKTPEITGRTPAPSQEAETPIPEAIPDGFKIIAEVTDPNAAEFDLNQLLPLDRLDVTTKRTHYKFTIVSGRDADLETNRTSRPAGRVRITGCTFGNSTAIKPDHLFYGGNLEFTYEREGTRRTHLTTSITTLRHLRPVTAQTGTGQKKGIPVWPWLATAAVLLLGSLVFIFKESGPGANAQTPPALTPAPTPKPPEPTPTTPESAPKPLEPTPATPEPAPKPPEPPAPAPAPKTSGPLTVESDPPGAAISLDDGPAQQAPHTFTDVPYGSHRLSATLDGYQPQRDERQFNAATTWRMHLQPIPAAEPDPLQMMVDRIKKDPTGSVEYISDCLAYLRYVQQHASSKDLDPEIVRRNLESVLKDLRDKQAPMKPSESKTFYTPYAVAVTRAAQLDFLPAILMVADNEEPHRAFKWYYYAAVVKHDPYAMTKLAQSYAKGADSGSGEKNYNEAFVWFERASQAGNKTASAYLCECYLLGLGTAKNQEKAVEDLKELAQEGVGPAECLLGESYINGWGGLDKKYTPAQREASAISLFKNAADHGEWNGYALLGQRYESGLINEKGERLPPDLGTAETFYQKGVDNENPLCRFALGHLLYDQAVKGQENAALKHKAVELILLAAEAEVPRAQTWRSEHPADVKKFETELPSQ
jgi:serine/threonine protein kinase/TPR repeat protein